MSSTKRLQPSLVASPVITPENEAYFLAAAEGRLLVKECSDCGKVHFYPRAVCPFCHSSNTQWRESTGHGRVYAYTVVSAKPASYVLAYVTLDEGVTMLSQLVDVREQDLRVDLPVVVRFVVAPNDSRVPVFEPFTA